MTLTKYLLRIPKEQPLRFTLLVIISVIGAILEGLGIALFVPLLQLVQDKGTAGELGRIGSVLQAILNIVGIPLTLGSALVLVLLVAVVQQASVMAQSKIGLGTALRYEADLRLGLYRTFFEASWPFFLRHKSGRLANALTAEVTRAKNAFVQFIKFIAGIITALIYAALAIALSWQMAIASLLVSGAALALLKKQVGRASKYGQDITTANAEAQGEIVEKLGGVKLVKGSAAERQTIAKFKVFVRDLARSQYEGSMNQAWLRVRYQIMTVGLVCFVIYVAVVYLNLQLAKLFVFLIVFYRLGPKLSEIQGYQHEFYLQIPALNVVDDLMREAESMREEYRGRREATFNRSLQLNEVGFSYVPGTEVLKKVTIDIAKGKTIAVVGSSGAGKSTVVDLLLGLIVPTEGAVLVDGEPLTELDLRRWREQIGYVSQDTILFHDTVAANIKWAAPGVGEEEVIEAAKMADAHDFITTQLSDGYNTIIGERGARLSGGQRQRLALARALIRKPKLLILDEATSALDAAAEQRIQKVIEKISGAMTMVIITHRFFTVRLADNIYVLENGRLVDSGSWRQLAAKPGRFSELQKLQRVD